MIVAAISDLMSFRIPNWLTLLTAVLFFPMAWLTGMPLVEFGWHLAAGLILFVAGFALFSFGLFGGGDARRHTRYWRDWSSDVCSSDLLIMTVFEIHGPGENTRLVRVARKIRPKLPYGFAFAIGAIVAFPQSWWMTGAA